MLLGWKIAGSIDPTIDKNECQWMVFYCDWLHNGTCSGHRPTSVCTPVWLDTWSKYFTALHKMQTLSSDENFVCPSVRPSVRKTCALWQNERKICADFMPYEWSFSLVFWEEEWMWAATPSTWNFGSTGPHRSQIADFEPIFARSTSAVTRSEKKFN